MATQRNKLYRGLYILIFATWLASCGNGNTDGNESQEKRLVTTQSGVSHYVTTRHTPPELEDDPETTNDESNDQPTGYYGTKTLCVHSYESGNTYTLDVDVSDDREVEQIYFPKGGWISFTGCELDEDLAGDCDDDEGRDWEFQGEC